MLTVRSKEDRAMVHQFLITGALLRCKCTACGICTGQTGTGTGFSPRTFWYLPVNYHSTSTLRSFGYQPRESQ